MKILWKLFYAANLLFSTSAFAQHIAAGYGHSLAICIDNTVWAWGWNNWGQLGNGTNINKTLPVQVSGLTGMSSVGAGQYHSLFLKNDGTVWACGKNDYGQLGDGTTIAKNIPVQVSGLTDIIAIEAGEYNSLFLKNNGTVWACGLNQDGQLGIGTADTHAHTIPVQVIGLTGIIAISAAYDHSLFLKNDGTSWACGYNDWGQIGDGTGINRHFPVQVSGLTGITAIAAGEDFSLFLRNDSTVYACGYNRWGQIGAGTATAQYLPVQITGLTGITAINAGYAHSLFLKNDGTTWACGYNDWGQIGDGTRINRHFPVQVIGLTDVTGIAAGVTYSLFQKNNGTAWGCGYNELGQLGNGTSGGIFCNCPDPNCCTLTPPVQVQNLCTVAPPSSTIFGRILSETGTPIPGVTVYLTGDDTDSLSTTTDGKYSFNVETGDSYTITPSKSNNVVTNNGITSIDVLLMRRHLLGIGALPSPYKIIAAAECNAAGDTLVLTADILLTRQLILGQSSSFPTNRLWQFVPSDYVFPDVTNPFPFPTTRTYTNITTNQTGQDFIGIKLGDVNNSWDANIP